MQLRDTVAQAEYRIVLLATASGYSYRLGGG
jgi:hypothetical protein